MITTYNNRGLLWIDCISPTGEEISSLIKQYSLHPLVGEELVSPSSGAKIDFHKDYLMVVLTLPVRTNTDSKHSINDREIDFVIGKNFLITARYGAIEQIEYFSKIFETNAILDKSEQIEHAGHLFYYMVKRLYGGMRQDLANMRDAIKSAESRVFSGDERRMVETLSNLRREFIDFKQIARVHHEIWQRLTDHGIQFFGDDYSSYVEDLRNEFEDIHNLIINARELLTDLHETNDSLLNTKQNETIKILTLVAFIFSPLTLIAAIFTIPAKEVPLIESVYGWPIIIGGMIVLALITLYYFKQKRWI